MIQHGKLFICIFLFLFLACSLGSGKTIVTRDMLDGLEVRSLSSFYFDRAMNYKNSRFNAVSFSQVVDRYDPDGTSDAVILDCLDDYQGIVSVDDIRNHDLQLATEIHLALGSKKPSWLNPLLVLVPDGSRAPFQERFMTANIRALRFVKLEEYYAPLDKIVGDDKLSHAGLTVFKNNCLFCHSLKGVGGGKGGSLTDHYDFSSASERQRFQQTFRIVHGKDHPDKQTVRDFIPEGQLTSLTRFLSRVR